MSSKPAEPRSIATQLVLLFTPAAALLLFCGLGVFYWLVVRHTFEEDNVVLADKVAALRADLKESGPQRVGEELQAARSGEDAAYWVRVVDVAGNTLAETPGMSRLLPAPIFPAGREGAAIDHRAGGRLFSLMSAPGRAGGQAYTIQVAQDRSPDEEFTREFGVLLIVVMAFGIVASALIAITVTKRGLRPLVEMTRSVKRVGPSRLDERVAPTSWPRELQPVAIAFDDMLDRLEESFTRLSQFSADLAHELRTPIANIRGEAEVALTQPRTPDEYRAVIESSVAECERLTAMIENLLFLARAEAADRQIERTLFDARAAIEKIANYYAAVAEERRITISCEGSGEMDADEMLFGRAVSNLVDNALHSTPDGGTIRIRIAARNREAEISVTDSGSGIAPEHLPRVFDRLYRADPSRNSGGTGLGLALVKSIAQMHGGSATIASELGRGTTVTLAFPTASVGGRRSTD
jgi:two-component system heavy metal sensor histidine kinase CusS